MKKINKLLNLFFLFFFFSCALEEYFYLPPVTDVAMTMSEKAEIVLPGISMDYYYIDNFTIFYRIYLSNHPSAGLIDTTTEMNDINPQLESDYNYFNNYFIYASNSQVPTRSTFINKNYYELITTPASLLNASAGDPPRRIEIKFDTSGEAAYIDSSDMRIMRNNNAGFNIKPQDNPLFIYDNDILLYDDAAGPSKSYNGDVIGTANTEYTEIYVSMYIVTTGTQTNFQPIYSKPKHIGIFRISQPQP